MLEASVVGEHMIGWVVGIGGIFDRVGSWNWWDIWGVWLVG